MLRTPSVQAWLIGLLAGMASFCALNAFGEQTYSVVAQSTKATAATGRKPISQRLAASNLPPRPPVEARAPVETPCSAEGCRLPDAVEPEAVPDHAAEAVAAPEPEALEQPRARVADATARPSPRASQPSKAPRHPQPEPKRQTLLDRVKTALTGRPTQHRQPAGDSVPLESRVPMPMPVPEREQTAAVITIEEPGEMPEIATDEDTVADTGTDADAEESPQLAIVPAEDASPTDAPADTTIAEAAVEDADARAEEPLAEAPARLEFDIRESRSLVSEGEQVVMRIAVRNVGGEAAEGVHATLFFADGMEPVRAIGHTAEVYPGEVRFGEVPKIAPGTSVDLVVTAIGTRPGHVVYRGEVQCSQFPGRIAHEGAVTVRARKKLK